MTSQDVLDEVYYYTQQNIVRKPLRTKFWDQNAMVHTVRTYYDNQNKKKRCWCNFVEKEYVFMNCESVTESEEPAVLICCCWGWWKFCSSMGFRDTLLGPVGLAGLGMDQMVLFFFCDFFWGLGMLKRPEMIVCGDIGLVLLSGLGSRRTHPVGVEGATMARRAPFPLSSIPAYIAQSMKLFVCLVWCVVMCCDVLWCGVR